MAGRLLGGIATSILYSGFESWLVYTHNKKSFPPEWLSSTFSLAIFGNGLVAILSGLLANSLKDFFGFVAPFDGSLVLLIIGSLIIFFTWEENYGDETISDFNTFRNAWNTLIGDRKIVMLGLIQSLFEGGMFTFVFMWTPALNPKGDVSLPHGWIFATFMVCVMTGSSLFRSLIEITEPESFMRIVFLVSTVALSVPIFFQDPTLIFLSFLTFEATVGIFWPALGTMRSKYIPESSRATIMNFFRIPLNGIVVLLLYNVGALATTSVFTFCCIFLFASFICQQVLYQASRTPQTFML